MKNRLKRHTALLLSIIILLASIPLLGAAAPETDAYQFIHDESIIYWHRSPHRYSYVEGGKTKNGYIPAMYHLVSNGESFAAYCCDLVTTVVEGTAYKRINLEDVSYISEEFAARIRGILNNGYWIGYTDSDLESLAEKAGVTNLTAAEALSATQLAIWNYANNTVLADLYYGTRNVSKDSVKDPVTVNVNEGSKSSITVIPKADKNINAVFDYLIKQKDSAPESVVWSFSEEISAAAVETDNGYDVTVKFQINGSNDDVEFVLKTELYTEEGTETLEFTESSLPEKDEEGCYSVTFENISESALSGELNVNLSLSGTQKLEEDVYFYEPEGGRDTAQSFVGFGEGETPIADSISAELTSENLEIFTKPEPEEIPTEPETETVTETTTEAATTTTQAQTTTTTAPETTAEPVETTKKATTTTTTQAQTTTTTAPETTAEPVETTKAEETNETAAKETEETTKSKRAARRFRSRTQEQTIASDESSETPESVTKTTEDSTKRAAASPVKTTAETAAGTTVKTTRIKAANHTKPAASDSSTLPSSKQSAAKDADETTAVSENGGKVAAAISMIIPDTGSDSSAIIIVTVLALAGLFLLVCSKKKKLSE